MSKVVEFELCLNSNRFCLVLERGKGIRNPKTQNQSNSAQPFTSARRTARSAANPLAPAHAPACFTLARARFFPSWAGPNTPAPARPKPRPHPAPHIPVPARTTAHSAPARSRSAAASADSPAPPVRTSSLLPFPALRNRARNGRRDHRGSLSPARMPRSRHPFKLTPRPPAPHPPRQVPPPTLATAPG